MIFLYLIRAQHSIITKLFLYPFPQKFIFDQVFLLMSISVLIIGASGAFGQPLLQEFIRQKSSFKTIAVLAATPQKAENYAWASEKGVKVVTGSFLDPKSYEGVRSAAPRQDSRHLQHLQLNRIQPFDFRSRQSPPPPPTCNDRSRRHSRSHAFPPLRMELRCLATTDLLHELLPRQAGHTLALSRHR